MNEYDSLKASLYDNYFTGVEGDTDFYVSEAVRAQGTVLELGCGTGRITIPMALAGVGVVGLDSSAEMLVVAHEKLGRLAVPVRRRIRLVQGDMRIFDLGRRFRLVAIPYRTFMHLLTPQDQIQALLTIREHLRKDGQLIFNIFDPSHELASHPPRDDLIRFDTQFTHPENGHRVMAWYRRRYDVIEQIIKQDLFFEELDEGGAVLAKHHSPLTLRYTHRYEMHYLLELCGYEVVQLYGDFQRSPYRGDEQIWVARHAR